MAQLIPSAVDVWIRWAKRNTSLMEVCNGVSSTLPKLESQKDYPRIQVNRIIGEPVFPEVPMDKARLQFNIWGGVKSNGLPDWGPADLLVRTLEAEMREFVQAEVDEAVIESMSLLEGIMQLPDPDTGQARFWMDAIVVVRSK